MKYRLLILIMCSSSSRFKKLENSIKRTWGTYLHDGIKIIFYTDNQKTLFKKKTPQLKGNNLILPCKDGYLNCTEKTLQAFEFVAGNINFEYVFRTNLGSYVNLYKIFDFLTDKPKENFYSGIIGTHKNDDAIINFASGSGYFLSKDMVELVVSGRGLFNHQVIDDVALGEFMANRHIPINKQAIRLSYVNDLVEYHIGDRTVDHIDHNLIYHIRLRSSDRNIDIKKMHELFNSKL
jgi:hypothetical protein